MSRLLLVLVLLLACCGAPAQQASEETTPLEPMFTTKLPDPPAEVPPDKRLAVPVSECVVEGTEPPEKTPPGILLSTEMAMRAGRLKVAYDEMRGLYEVDLRTMDRERQVYVKQLDLADQEIARLREEARRSWWETHGAKVMLAVGVVTGAALTIGVAAALDAALAE